MSCKSADEIKNLFKKDSIFIDSFVKTESILFLNPINKYLVFNNISLKNYFLENTDRSVINCNTSYSRFTEEVNNYFDDFTIFNNIKYCTDIKILEIINKTSNLKIE